MAARRCRDKWDGVCLMQHNNVPVAGSPRALFTPSRYDEKRGGAAGQARGLRWPAPGGGATVCAVRKDVKNRESRQSRHPTRPPSAPEKQSFARPGGVSILWKNCEAALYAWRRLAGGGAGMGGGRAGEKWIPSPLPLIPPAATRRVSVCRGASRRRTARGDARARLCRDARCAQGAMPGLSRPRGVRGKSFAAGPHIHRVGPRW